MNSLLQYFGSSYLINLPERADRLNGAIAELVRIGWDFGPHGVQLFPARKFSDRAGFPNAGARGAFCSHWECLQRAHAEKKKNVLVLEDDIAFSSALPRLTPSIVSCLDAADWDFVYFGHSETGNIPNADAKLAPDELRLDSCTADIQGLHFYAVSGRVLARLTSHLAQIASGVEGDQQAGPMPADGAINTFRRKNPEIRTFIVRPKLGWQRPSRSDITPSKLDRIQVLRPLTTALRNMKHLASAWRS